MRSLLLTFFFLPALALTAQDNSATYNYKGRLFLYWGYNRSAFTNSDIHFEGPGYDLTMQDVTAADRPHRFSTDTYLNPKYVWYPQYNYRLGWYIREDWSISMGLDHMKYVVDAGQEVNWEGELGVLTDERPATLVLDSAVLQYEHTDGLNLVSVDVDRYWKLWRSANARTDLRLYTGAHAGPVIARSDVRLFSEGMNNRFNLAGYGLGVQTGLHFTFLQHFFVRNTLRAGYIHMPNVLTTGNADEQASQHFGFLQHAIVAGGCFRIGGKK